MQRDGEGARPRPAAIAARLEEVLGESLGGELRRLSSGASRETFAFELPSRGALVAQLARGGAKLNQAPPAAPLLEAAARAGVREHLNRLGIGLHNDPQSEISMIGNFPTVILAHEFGTPAQREAFVGPALKREVGLAFGLTEPNHGSDATYMETTARSDPSHPEEYVLNGVKRFNSGMHTGESPVACRPIALQRVPP